MEVLYSPHFKREAKKLPRSLRTVIEKRLRLFMEDPFNPSLKTHKLSGRLRNYWAFSIDYKIRVIFSFQGRSTAKLHTIGDHTVYDKI